MTLSLFKQKIYELELEQIFNAFGRKVTAGDYAVDDKLAAPLDALFSALKKGYYVSDNTIRATLAAEVKDGAYHVVYNDAATLSSGDVCKLWRIVAHYDDPVAYARLLIFVGADSLSDDALSSEESTFLEGTDLLTMDAFCHVISFLRSNPRLAVLDWLENIAEGTVPSFDMEKLPDDATPSEISKLIFNTDKEWVKSLLAHEGITFKSDVAFQPIYRKVVSLYPRLHPVNITKLCELLYALEYRPSASGSIQVVSDVTGRVYNQYIKLYRQTQNEAYISEILRLHIELNYPNIPELSRAKDFISELSSWAVGRDPLDVVNLFLSTMDDNAILAVESAFRTRYED